MSAPDFELDQIQQYVRETFDKHRDQFPDINDAIFEFTVERFIYILSLHKSESVVTRNKFLSRQTIRKVVYKSIVGKDPGHVASRILDLCFPHTQGILMPGYNPYYVPRIENHTSDSQTPRLKNVIPPAFQQAKADLNSSFSQMCNVSEYGKANIEEISTAVEKLEQKTKRHDSSPDVWLLADEEVWYESEMGYDDVILSFSVPSGDIRSRLEREWAQVTTADFFQCLKKCLEWLKDSTGSEESFNLLKLPFSSFFQLRFCPIDAEQYSTSTQACSLSIFKTFKSWTLEQNIYIGSSGGQGSDMSKGIQNLIIMLTYFQTESPSVWVDSTLLSQLEVDLEAKALPKTLLTELLSLQHQLSAPCLLSLKHRVVTLSELVSGDAVYTCQQIGSIADTRLGSNTFSSSFNLSNKEYRIDLISRCRQAPWQIQLIVLTECEIISKIDEIAELLSLCPNVIFMIPVGFNFERATTESERLCQTLKQKGWKHMHLPCLSSSERKNLLAGSGSLSLTTINKIMKATTNWPRPSFAKLSSQLSNHPTSLDISECLQNSQPSSFLTKTVAKYISRVNSGSFEILDNLTLLTNQHAEMVQFSNTFRNFAKDCMALLNSKPGEYGTNPKALQTFQTIFVNIEKDDETNCRSIEIIRMEDVLYTAEWRACGIRVLEVLSEAEQSDEEDQGAYWNLVIDSCQSLLSLLTAIALEWNATVCCGCEAVKRLKLALNSVIDGCGIDVATELREAVSKILRTVHRHEIEAKVEFHEKSITSEIIAVLIHTILGFPNGWIEFYNDTLTEVKSMKNPKAHLDDRLEILRKESVAPIFVIDVGSFDDTERAEVQQWITKRSKAENVLVIPIVY
ncbi:hypothetical protein BCR33DRAFT_720465 [Rhizoclosmatium globosum]|uniref:Uncharacterized protein n=1 Tax=Rhizoclosmatium globosum TaxID=329046 RepID=A0A1Y2BVH8_9FUNG|nr:hypothetical protein BCR33DRAFT_720465 [Rhizoclosmatium globosum]|eukprot:ORY38782.1 hypothetical protein BCR33DRAFT_720465 [Rhizoclosmatium globosum]